MEPEKAKQTVAKGILLARINPRRSSKYDISLSSSSPCCNAKAEITNHLMQYLELSILNVGDSIESYHSCTAVECRIKTKRERNIAINHKHAVLMIL